MTNCLFFIHIPKTAGTSLRLALEAQFEAQNVLDVYHQEEMTRLDDAAINRHAFIRGHIPYCMIRRMTPRPALLTMLRDPVERALSNLRHVKNTPDALDWLRREVDFNRSLDDLIAEPRIQDWLRDVQLKWIAGNFPTRRFTRPMIFQVPHADEAMLEEGILRLHTIDMLGITERFDDSIRLINACRGWRIAEAPRANTRQSRPNAQEEISAASRRRLEQVTDFDRRFYDYASRLFEKRLAHYGL